MYKRDVSTVLDYLYKRYDCDDIETLQCRCPVDLNRLNLDDEVTEEFVDCLNDLEERDDECIAKIIKERDVLNTEKYLDEDEFGEYLDELGNTEDESILQIVKQSDDQNMEQRFTMKDIYKYSSFRKDEDDFDDF